MAYSYFYFYKLVAVSDENFVIITSLNIRYISDIYIIANNRYKKHDT